MRSIHEFCSLSEPYFNYHIIKSSNHHIITSSKLAQLRPDPWFYQSAKEDRIHINNFVPAQPKRPEVGIVCNGNNPPAAQRIHQHRRRVLNGVIILFVTKPLCRACRHIQADWNMGSYFFPG